MKLNKTLMIAALAVGSLFAGNLALQAQDNTNTPPAGRPPGGMRGRGLTIETVAKQLDLTDDQKAKVKPIIEDYNTKMMDMRKDTTIAPADRRAKAKEIRDATTAQLKDILTADQLAKWTKMGAGNRRPPAATPPQN